MHLHHHILQLPSTRLVAVIECRRVEAVAKIAQVGDHPDRSLGPPAGFLRNTLPYRSINTQPRVAKVIPAPQEGEIHALGRPEPAPGKNRIELTQVEAEHEDPVAEAVCHRQMADMADMAGVEAAVHSSLLLK